MENRVLKRVAAAVVAATMLSGAALAAPADDLKTAANKSNLLRQGSAQAVTATAEGAAVTVNDLALPSGGKTSETITVLVESDGNIRYILGTVSGGSVAATYQENGASSFTMLAAQAAIDQGSLTIASGAVQNDSGYDVTYTANLTMSDDLAMLAAENRADSERLKALRFTCVLEDDLLAQLTSVSEADVKLQGNSSFEFVSAQTTDAGISIVYKLVPSVVDSWKAATVTAADVKDQLQQPMSISCTKTASEAQVTAAQNSDGDIYTYGALTITYEPSGRPTAIPTLGTAVQVVIPGKLAQMAFDNAGSSIADPAVTGVSTWLITDDHLAFMNGDTAGTFRPDASIKRSEVAQLFYNLLRDQNVPTTVAFTDVSENAWYADAVNALASLGIINGVGENRYNPDRYIKRSEFAAICARFAKATATGTGFTDVAASYWAYDEIITAASYGWITGMGDGTFDPERSIKRCEAATMVNRMLGRLPDESAIDAGAGTRFPDVASTHWAWYQIVEATSAHSYTMNSTRTQETWTVE